MDRFVVRIPQAGDADRESGPATCSGKHSHFGLWSRFTWRHPLTQVQGRLDSSYKRALLHKMLSSLTEIGSLTQLDVSELHSLPRHNATPSGSSTDQGFDAFLNRPNISHREFMNVPSIQRPCIADIEFDLKGVYLASVSNVGSLAIHDYESLYYHAQDSRNSRNVAPVVQFVLPHKLVAVSWNPKNQDEVACAAAWGGKVYIYDIACVSDVPSQVLKVAVSNGKTLDSTGLLDLAFCEVHANRVFACGKYGEVNVWDRRASNMPQSVFSSQHNAQLSSISLTTDGQIFYAASSLGQIHAWDSRGGRSSAAFLVPGKTYNPPLSTWKISKFIEQIPALRAQTEVDVSGIQSISLNKFCEQQLAFHLINGWSGVFDLSSLQVTHIHCPPPPWLDNEGEETVTPNTMSVLERRPTWLSASCVYACPSSLSSKIHFLDFRPGPRSPHYIEENENETAAVHLDIHTTHSVVGCASHPLNDQLVAGSEGAFLLVIGHKGTGTR